MSGCYWIFEVDANTDIWGDIYIFDNICPSKAIPTSSPWEVEAGIADQQGSGETHGPVPRDVDKNNYRNTDEEHQAIH